MSAFTQGIVDELQQAHFILTRELPIHVVHVYILVCVFIPLHVTDMK